MIDNDIRADKELMKNWLELSPDASTVSEFQPGPHIDRLNLQFDIEALKTALEDILLTQEFFGDVDTGFGAIPLTRMPDRTDISANDLSGRYWLRPDNDLQEVAREDFVDEAAFTDLKIPISRLCIKRLPHVSP